MSSKRFATGDTIYASHLFTRQELVGRGAYGSVYKGVDKSTQQVVAIKVLNLDTEEEDVSDIQREIATLSTLKNCDSQNITRYHGSFLDGTKLWIVMDYAAGGSIRSLLQALPKIEEKCIAIIAREVLQALCYLHKHGIIHRDIKAANILLTDEGRVQLCDFGVAGQVTMNSLKRNSFVGTPYWMAPEVIREGQTYDYKADIWSFGITIYEIATGNPPFADQDPMRAVTLIPKTRPAQLEGDWSPAMKEFVGLCLHEEPNMRPSAEDLLKSKWIKNTSKNSTVLLKELVARFEQHKQDSAHHKDETSSDIDIDHELENFDMEVEQDGWRFDTAKTVPKVIPSRTSSLGRPSLDSKSDISNGTKSPILSTQDSGVAIQSRTGNQNGHTQSKSEDLSMTKSTTESSPTVKAKSSKNQKTPKSQPPVISHDSHHLLRLFIHTKNPSEEDVSTMPPLPSQTPHMSAPISLTIPNLDTPNGRLASRSPIPNNDSSISLDLNNGASQQQNPSAVGGRPPESSRIPFGFNMTKPFRYDRRPSAPILMGSAPGPDYPLYNQHVLNRGPPNSSPLTSPKAVPLPTQPSILANMHTKQGTQDTENSNSTPMNRNNSGQDATTPIQNQLALNQNIRPNSTPASPAIPPTALMGASLGSLNGSTTTLNNILNPSKDGQRLTGQRRPSPTMSSSLMMPNQQQQIQQTRDARNNLPPAVPHRKASLDFSQVERQSHLRPSLPMRPPSAAAVRSSTFHGLDSAPLITSTQSTEGVTNSITSISSGLAALGMQPINISEERLPPYGQSAAHMRMINAYSDHSGVPAHEKHRGSVTSSDRDVLSPASSVSSDPASSQIQGTSLSNLPSLPPSSVTLSASPALIPTSTSSNGSFSTPGSSTSTGSVLVRPGLRTVGSSENFARRVRSTSVLKKNEEQDLAKSGFHPSRPPYSGQQGQQPTTPLGHYHQHPGYQQQQYSYTQETNASDIHRYRRASSPRRRSISMTNLNGGPSVVMIPTKKSNTDDYAANPLLLPPSPSTTRFITPTMGNSAMSSSPLRPALHSMPSSSSLSSSYGSISAPMAANHASLGISNGMIHGNQQLNTGSPFVGHSNSLSPSIHTNISTSPPSLPTTSTHNSINTQNNITSANPNNTKSSMSITSQTSSQNGAYSNSISTSHNAPTQPGLMGSISHQNISQNTNPYGQHYHQQYSSSQLQLQQQGTPIQYLIVTPEPRSLHMDSLRRSEDLMEELQMAVGDLSQWLEIFETSMKSVRSS